GQSMDEIVRLVSGLVTPAPGYEAPHLVNQGRYLLRRRGDALRKALERFERAIEIDPRSAAAQAGVAEALGLLAVYGFERSEKALVRAIASAESALALDPMLAEAHVASGFVRFALAWDWEAARSSFVRALEIAPDA